MIIAIGSRSEPKITGITRAFSRYPEIWLNDSDNITYLILPKDVRKEIISDSIDKVSKVSLNPMSLNETIIGSKNRAKEAYDYALLQEGKCDYSFGLESGFYPVVEVKTGFMMNSICSIYNGKDYYIGFSPSF